ncbi:piggyBac transposable element-derived protein 4-like [Leptopilina boulardi]|uniref:piggyBac transposable element-derived protein 4-like n=1 Tax=Leptopilina boulardi TaxID=63433 RepID=UPI0021F5E23B|nr:piggyBac transposable element-derived protein 4-like [Leptopilina boulardi]
MPYNRFRQLLSLLYFVEDDENSTDKLHKIRPVLEALTENFQKAYRPGENICIDESLVPWKGRLHFKQFNPLKRSRFGIKLFVFCESKTGYVYDIETYVGNENDTNYVNKGIGKSGSVVKRLLGDLSGQGRSLHIDNWYTSPLLCKQLVDEKTNVCGTVRINRKYMPKV